MFGKSGRHFPVRAKFKVAEETVWVTRSYERKGSRDQVLWGRTWKRLKEPHQQQRRPEACLPA